MRKLETRLLFCVTLAACSGSGGGSQMAATAPETLVGEIQLTGSAPAFLVTLTTAEGRSVDLTGDLRGELQDLSGAEVSVWGRLASARDFQVMSYEIRAIQGQQPLVPRVRPKAIPWGAGSGPLPGRRAVAGRR